jgi:hypothetical protein
MHSAPVPNNVRYASDIDHSRYEAQLLVDYRVTLIPGRSATQLVIAALNLTAAAVCTEY